MTCSPALVCSLKSSADSFLYHFHCAPTDFMAQTGTPRSEIFYTTKLMKNLGYEHVKRSIQRSLDLAGLDYL